MLTIAKKSFDSRLLLGSSGYPTLKHLEDALKISGSQIVTVAIRRISLESESAGDSLIKVLSENHYFLLPNTAGCYTAEEAILTAKLSREALKTNWIKLEVIGDSYSLFPDNEQLLKAARTLINDGFVVLPYCNDDPIVCKKLADLGCSAVMPLGAPIGSGQGIRNPHNLELIRKMVSVPMIVDAGVGTASHAAFAMELGADGVLMNTAVAKAKDPVKMALAMKNAVEAGRLAFEAGRIPEKKFATPSTPDRGKIVL
ncbi:MAG TPA: thiazole synthase [Deltaproteobacteria bacterium]|nr:MAG: thiazole synthase [Deltaproteobacteria bacterium GWA2_45_12]HBF12882.1 thiazole synthase [Deltaproteobacteria bacterium]